ncbi:B3 domain-containing protein Os01g0234100-like isoform X1 [Nicotiana tabacum]|uniref:B3 domain-containing protein Os01g0234100-like n=3 Tax=Nicotiana tabacum TaxID=4097 RepID=A0A1S4DIB1_TOBAC|nr:PREDICTED: B3 domain-containing protein Os01g0234100-like [Nicotiana tabacum]
MAISAMYSSKKSPLLSSFKKKALEIKKKLLRKRVLGPSQTYKRENGDNKKVQLCHEKKANKPSTVDANSSAMLRAEEVQANLPSQFPSFAKFMLPSHVTGGFWLGFPKKFCDRHLPKHDDTVVLVDEDEQEYATKYLVDKTGLSGGWRGFSIAHSLLHGDVLIFQLIQPCKFKVYMIRESTLTELDGAISLLNLDFHARPIESDQIEDMKICEAKELRYLEPPVLDTHQDDKQEIDGAISLLKLDFRARPIKSDQDEGMNICEAKEEKYLEPSVIDIDQDDENEEAILVQNLDQGAASDQCGNDNDISSEVLGIRFSESRLEFKDVKDFSGFNILVDGLIVDSEIPAHIRNKYYDLCCTQKSFLHDHLLGGLNCKLAAGMITETVNIADAIRASNISTSRDYLEAWDNTLKGFECLGMEVGFLRARLNKLVSLSSEPQQILESKRNELVEAKEEMRNLETKLLKVKQVIKNLDSEIDLTTKDASFELKFKAVAAAPWS